MPEASAKLLRRLLDAALAAVAVERCLPAHLPRPPAGRTVVVGAGKAAAAMARVVDRHWRASDSLTGLVVTRYGHGLPPLDGEAQRIEVIEAAHPVPDRAGQQAAQRILALTSGLAPEDLLLCLISGGGSALLALPAPGLTLEDKRVVTRALLACGATIHEINCVRKHLSGIKGGRLATHAAPARIVTLLVSDVPGDDPAVIASGPTLPDPTTRHDALAVLAKYHVIPPSAVTRHLHRAEAETPKPGDPRFPRSEARVIASAQEALEQAATTAGAAGLTPLILGNALEGESREVARVHAGIVRQILRHGQPVAPPCVILSGGETTVTVRGRGQGGRNTEFLLALALALAGAPGVSALACDTDGCDGVGQQAGALLFPESLARATLLGLDAGAFLAINDSAGFFGGLEDLVVTGPTRTNVNDFRAIVVDPTGRVVSSGREGP